MAKQTDAALRAHLTEIADMVEALVRSLSDADVVTRADLLMKMRAIQQERAKSG